MVDAGGGRIGDAAYAELIAEQLALDNVLRHYMRGAASGPAADHFLASYEKGLRVLPPMRLPQLAWMLQLS